MRIAICGAHGVGKTTLANYISKELGLPILPDIVVDAHRLGFTINESTPIETQIWLTGKQLENERSNKDYIADKCIFDYYIYAKALKMDPELVNILKKIAIKNGTYDHIFYIHPEFPLVNDGLRSMNQEFQDDIENEYFSFLKTCSVHFVELSGSREERVKKVLKSIN